MATAKRIRFVCKSLLWFVILGFSQYLVAQKTNLSPIVSLKQISANEPSLAIHPSNPAVQVIAANVDVYWVSKDSGYTWEQKKISSTFGVYGDPVLQFSTSGALYFAHLSKTSGKKHPEMFDRIVLQKAVNPESGFNNGIGVGYNQGKMQDKPWIAIQSGETHDKDMLLLSWTEFDTYKSKKTEDSARIRVAVSTNGGTSFESIQTISDHAGSCMDNSATPEGATPVILSDGSMHVVWSMNENLYYDFSIDSGRTWHKDKILESQVGGWSIQKPGIMRSNAMPFLVKGKKDELILVWADSRNGAHQVFLKTSKNKGKSWSKTQQISKTKTRTKDSLDCFMPFVKVNQQTGELMVLYYALNLQNKDFVYVMAYSSIHKHSLVCPLPFLSAGEKVFFGDYVALDASKKSKRAVWTTHQKGEVFLQTSSLYKLGRNKHDKLVVDFRKDKKELFVYLENKKADKFKVRVTETETNSLSNIAQVTDYSSSPFKGKSFVYSIPKTDSKKTIVVECYYRRKRIIKEIIVD